MNSNLESFRPKLRAGRVIPQGSRIIFETDNPYNQIVLPVVLADLVLLCSGQFSVREIMEKIYRKQGAVPFKSMLTAIHLLHQGGFFENGDQLVLSSHLQSWMAPQKRQWNLSWRFGQRIAAAAPAPTAYYVLTLVTLVASIFGLQYFPTRPVGALESWVSSQTVIECLFQLLICSSIAQSLRYLLCGVQLLLLTSKAYNVAFRLSPWGLHLHVGDEANDLFENRLYTSMFHVSQILAPWSVVLAASFALPNAWLSPLIAVAAIITLTELNPFINSDGRKLIRSLFIADDPDVVSWHFEASTLTNSINPTARQRDQDFVHVSALTGIAYLSVCLMLEHQLAVTFGPEILTRLFQRWTSVMPAVGFVAWLASLYLIVQAMMDLVGKTILRPYGKIFRNRIDSFSTTTEKTWPLPQVVKSIEGLPLFSHFHEHFLEKIAAQSQLMDCPKGAVITVQGDPSRELFVLLEGEIHVVRQQDPADQDWVVNLGAVSVFGESALVDETPRGASVVAHVRCVILKVPIHLLKEVALEAQSVRQLEVFRNAILVNQFFASSPVFRSLSASSIDFLCSRGTLEYFDQAAQVFEQGETGDSLYLILRGSVEVEVHQTPIKKLHQGSFFGEIALIANIPRTATIRTVVPCVFFKISSDAFWQVLVQHMDLGVFIENVSEARLKEDLAILPRPSVKQKIAS